MTYIVNNPLGIVYHSYTMEEDYDVFGLKMNCSKARLTKKFKEMKEKYKGDDVNTKRIYKARTNIELGRTKEVVEQEEHEKREQEEMTRNRNQNTTNSTHTFNGKPMSLDAIKKLPGIDSLKLVPGLENIFEDDSFFQGGQGFNEYFRNMMNKAGYVNNNNNGQSTSGANNGRNTVTNVSYVMRGGKMVKISEDTNAN